MKIAIISVNMHTKVLNFASPLHTVAFQQFLLQNGIESTVLDYEPCYRGTFDIRHPLFWYIDHPDSSKEKQLQLLKQWKELFYAREKRFDKFQEFIDEHYIKTDDVWNQDRLDEEDPGFDCYMCVTDILWNRNKNTGFDRGFWLASKCMEGKKKLAYTPSRGPSSYSLEDDKQILPWLADFDYLSVREEKFKEHLDDLTGLDIPQLLDPVFFQEREFYEKLAREPENPPERPYVLTNIVMQTNSRLLKKAGLFAEQKGCDVIELSEDYLDRDLPEAVHHRRVYDIGVEEWLWYILHAEYIFTNSFHQCVLSIILQKEFFAGKRNGDKIDSLLDLFDMQGRRIADDNMDTALSLPAIDWAPVEERRRALVKESQDFVLNAIKDLASREHRPLMTPEQLQKQLEMVDSRITEEQERAARKQAEAAAKLEADRRAREEAEYAGRTTDGRPLPRDHEEAMDEWNRIKNRPDILKKRVKRKLRNMLKDADPEPDYLKKWLKP